jgi:single-strand DNA-binding protein
MPNFCSVTLIGHLTRDPELKYTANNTAVCNFGMAINRKFKDKESVVFIDVTAWAKEAETITQYVKKGDALFVVGRLEQDNWEQKCECGKTAKRQKIFVTVERFQFLGGKRGEAESATGEQAAKPEADAGANAYNAVPF